MSPNDAYAASMEALVLSEVYHAATLAVGVPDLHIADYYEAQHFLLEEESARIEARLRDHEQTLAYRRDKNWQI